MVDLSGLKTVGANSRLTWDGRSQTVTAKEGEFLTNIVRWLKPRAILEIGTYVGISASYMLEGASGLEGCSLHSCDIKPEYLEEAKKRLSQYCNWELFVGYPEQDIKYDLIFIDGSHTQVEVARDYEYAKAHSHPGTVILAHDVNGPQVLAGFQPEVPAILYVEQEGFGLLVI